jgi:hypothetical protein
MTTTIRHLQPVTDEAKYTEWSIEFERALIYACVTHQRFWGLVGTHLNPESLRDDRGVEILKACNAIARETGEGPSSPLLVMRRLKERCDSGKFSLVELDRITTLIDDVEDDGGYVSDLSQLAIEAARVLQTRKRESLMREMAIANSRGKSLARFTSEIDAIESIGKEGSTGSIKLGRGAWTGIAAMQRVSKMPFGIIELDDELGGGVAKKTLTVIGADQGVGKTALMVHLACFNWMAGKRVIFLPTEESVPATMQRAIAWITGCSMDDVGRSDPKAKAKLDQVLASPNVGAFACEYLPQGSPVSKVRQLVDQAIEDHPEFGGGYDVLLVDYADKLAGKPSDRNSYERMGTVYEGLRQIAVDDSTNVVTGSQLKDRDGKATPIVRHLRDSSKKGDIADCVVLVYPPNDDMDERNYYIGKHRGRGAGRTVGPIPTDLDIGRIAPIASRKLLVP